MGKTVFWRFLMSRYTFDELNAFGPDGLGLELVCKNRNLLKSDAIDISIVPYWAFNSDRVCVKCGNCNQFMQYYPGPNNQLDGKWKCDLCEQGVTENRVYKKIEKENEDFEEKWLFDEEDDY